MNDHDYQAATALTIFTNGNQAAPEARLLFCNRLISLADLDGYPRRAEFIAAYSTGGTEEARRAEAQALAETGIVPTDYIVYCAKKADARSNSADFGSNPEIV